MFGLVAELLLHSSLKSHDGRFRLFGCGNRVSYLGVLHPKVNRVRVSYYIAEPELKSSFIGALSPVNHKRLYQGCIRAVQTRRSMVLEKYDTTLWWIGLTCTGYTHYTL